MKENSNEYVDNETNLDRTEGQIEGLNFATEILGEMKKTNKWQRIIIIILITVLFASNVFWLWNWMQYDYISYTQNGEGYNNINSKIGGNVENNNGTEIQSEIPEK